MKIRTLLLLLLCSIFYLSCNTKPAPPPLNRGDDTGKQYGGGYHIGGDTLGEIVPEQQVEPAEQDEIVLHQVHDIWSYSPQTVSVPENTTIERAVSSLFSNARRCYAYDNVGGIKLIGEMSADRAGYNYSFYPYSISLNVLPLLQLHLEFVSSCNNIIPLVLEGKVVVESAKIISGCNGLNIDVVVRNQTSKYQDMEFVQGQMIEVAEPHVQNVVIASAANVQMPPNGTWHFTLPVFCAAHHRSSPADYSARITPYVLNAPSTTFQSQQNVWDVLESNDDPNSYITFYVWGKGTVTSSGRRSPTGHAFLRIPQVGVFGFSSKSGGLLNDEGVIYDHTSKIQYATDSCRIKVSEEAKKAMTKKLRQLQQDVPMYRIGRYDCTSFVMDIADAGGIHYGTRITIQTPVGFMQELKKHNYSY